MDFKKYQEGAIRTVKPHPELTEQQRATLDWTIGLSGEVGEVSELIKHHIFHREPMNKMLLAKECGDILWYIAALLKEHDIAMEDSAELNLAKLQHRHGQSFDFGKSAERHGREEKFSDTTKYLELKQRIEGGPYE